MTAIDETEALQVRMTIPTDFAAHIVKSEPGTPLRDELMAMLGRLAVDAVFAALIERARE